MLSLLELHPVLHDLFGAAAELLAREAGFCRRARLLTGPVLARTLAFGLLRKPDSTLQDLADFAAEHLDVHFSPQALDQRMTQPAACFLRDLFGHALTLAFDSACPALLPTLRRFDGVYLRDATLIPLPPALAGASPGRTGRAGPTAALKLVVEAELTAGLLTDAEALPGTANEKLAGLSDAPLPPGSLLLEDMGFLAAERLQEYVDQGVYVLTRVPAWAAVFGPDGDRLDLVGVLEAGGWWLEREVFVFHQRVPMRLLAVRLPDEEAQRRRDRARKEAKARGRAASRLRLALCGWNVLVTNAPAEMLGVFEAWDVRRARWQIELLFKGLKSGGSGLGWSRTGRPWRALCEVYGKLLGALVRCWALLAAGFVWLRHSVLRCCARAGRAAAGLARAIGSLAALASVVKRLAIDLHRRCRLKRRRKGPSTLDRLAAHDKEFDPDEPIRQP